ncbi:MAG: hypothetical protein IIZ60_02600 [Clostridia bacterium]|nr:hypothetical protein [Clostridia bacterium]
MSQKKYSYVFVHGMLGFGESEKLYSVAPYWGMVTGSIVKRLRARGYEACAPSVSSLGSAWDRACELYAQLVGGTVDYGKVHSEKYGHARYGRTFDKPLLPDWGKLDEQGRLNKIHLLGHSFGGATVRTFSHLMANGSAEEIAGTDPSDLSPLFAGGKGDWLQSVTTVAGPHNGTTVMAAIGFLYPILKAVSFFGLGMVMGNTPLNKFYDMELDHWGITSDPREKPHLSRMFALGKGLKIFNSKDHLYYDLTLAGARDMNKFLEINESAYNFSISTSNSTVAKNGNHRMKGSTNPLFMFTGWLIGRCHYERFIQEEVGDEWLESDGASCTCSALHPDDEPFISYYDAKGKFQRGIWTVMPVFIGDHGDVIGGSYRCIFFPGTFRQYWDKYFKLLDSLDD